MIQFVIFIGYFCLSNVQRVSVESEHEKNRRSIRFVPRSRPAQRNISSVVFRISGNS